MGDGNYVVELNVEVGSTLDTLASVVLEDGSANLPRNRRAPWAYHSVNGEQIMGVFQLSALSPLEVVGQREHVRRLVAFIFPVVDALEEPPGPSVRGEHSRRTGLRCAESQDVLTAEANVAAPIAAEVPMAGNARGGRCRRPCPRGSLSALLDGQSSRQAVCTNGDEAPLNANSPRRLLSVCRRRLRVQRQDTADQLTAVPGTGFEPVRPCGNMDELLA